MKLQYFALCAAMAIPAAFAQEKPAETPKHFGNGTCLPKFLEQYDVDGDGMINEEERQAMVEARKQIRENLRQGWDKDADGKLSAEERQHAREQLRQMMEEKRTERFNEADTDDDGSISKEEFEALPGIADRLENGSEFAQKIVDMIFKRLAGEDELISLDEFLAIGHHGVGGGGHSRPPFGRPGHGGGNRPGPTDGGDDPVEG